MNPSLLPGSYFNEEHQEYPITSFDSELRTPFYAQNEMNYFNLPQETESFYGINYPVSYQTSDPFQNLHDVLPSNIGYSQPSLSSPFDSKPVKKASNFQSLDDILNHEISQHDSAHGLGISQIFTNNQSPKSTETDAESASSSTPENTHSGSGKLRGRRASSRQDVSESNRHFICDVANCNKVFKRSEHLKRHVRSIHTNEKPFPCPTCGKHFSRSDNLNQHMRIHVRPKTKISTIRAHPMINYSNDAFLPYLPFYPNSEYMPFPDYSTMMNNYPQDNMNDSKLPTALDIDLSFIQPSTMLS